MSSLAAVTHAPVSTVLSHGLSPTQPCVTRLGSALSVMTARGGGPLCTLASPLFHWHPLVSWWLAIPPVCLSVVSPLHSDLLVSSRVTEVFHLMSSTGCRYLPPSHRGSYPRSGLAPHSYSTPTILQHPGSLISADFDMRQPGAGPRNGPPEPQSCPHRSLLLGLCVAHQWPGPAMRWSSTWISPDAFSSCSLLWFWNGARTRPMM
jgi:hypothetical protein